MQGIFDPRWVYHHRATVASSELATIRVTRQTESSTWTPETGMSGGAETVLYEGKARWQKFGFITRRDHMSDAAQFQRVRVQIAFEEVDAYRTANGITIEPDYFHPNDRIELVENDANPDSVGSVVYLWGDTTSSNPWHHTFVCQENQKQDG